MASRSRRREAPPPAIVAERLHFDLAPRFRPDRPVEQQTTQRVVTVGEGVRLDHDRFVNGTLDRKATGVDLRTDVLDHRPRRAVAGQPVVRSHAPPPRRIKGLRTMTASGGKVSVSEWKWPCAATGAASTWPKLPMPLPP